MDEFPKKADDAVQPIATHVLPQLTDKDALRVLDVFTKGKASKLHEQGVPVDKIIRYAQKGKFDQLKLKRGGNAGNSKRLVTDGGISNKVIDRKLAKANKWNYHRGGKLTEKLRRKDLTEIGRDTTGEVIYLTDTPKWSQKTDIKQVNGWRHIVARHVQKNSKYAKQFKRTDGYPVKSGEAAGAGKGVTTMYPRKMAPSEIQNLIMKSAKSGHVVKNKPFKKVISYDVPKSSKYYKKYGIKEMKVVIRKKSGLVKTAYPTKGGVKYKNT